MGFKAIKYYYNSKMKNGGSSLVMRSSVKMTEKVTKKRWEDLRFLLKLEYIVFV